jgi:starvation-inducible outer membrane lipoprotein
MMVIIMMYMMMMMCMMMCMMISLPKEINKRNEMRITNMSEKKRGRKRENRVAPKGLKSAQS